MPMTITDLAFRVALITETLAQNPGWGRELTQSELTSARLDEGRNALVDTLAKLEAVSEHADDHTSLEQARRGITELDGWYQTTRRNWGRALGVTPEGNGDFAVLLGVHLEGHDELFIVLLRCWRLVSTARVRESMQTALRSAGRRVEDDLQRGYVLLRKAAKSLNKTFHLAPEERRHGVSYGDLTVARDNLESWLQDFASAATTLYHERDPERLGLLGIVPEGIGTPLGGTAYQVILHERARIEAPHPVPASPCAGWGTGAAGNRENYWEAG